MMLDYDFVLKKSQEAKIDSITIQREYWQLLFLQRLYFSTDSQNIFFKGGTAIRFLFNSFRFSEDIDFTALLGKREVENLIISTFSFFKKGTKENLELKKEKVLKKFDESSIKFRFLFQPMNSNQKVSIRIDISLREKPLTRNQTLLVPFDYPISPYPLVLHLTKEEMLAEKIRALFIRDKPRDLFDIWYLLTKKVALDEIIVNKKFMLYTGISFSKEKLQKIVKEFSESDLKKDLNQFLPQSHRQFYKQLKNEVLKFI